MCSGPPPGKVVPLIWKIFFIVPILWKIKVSSLKNIPPLANSSFIGELGLSGQVRKSNNLRTKIEEAVRLGIKNILVPKLEVELNNNFQNLINIKEISNIKEAVDYSLSK